MFRSSVLAAILIFCSCLGWAQDERFIRLRNTTISTPKADRSVAAQSRIVAAPESGLFLIQFEDRLLPEWKQALEAEGVSFLHYVPDDAFIVRARSVNFGRIRSLPCVRWAGAYEPGYKIHPRLGKVLADENVGLVPIRILVEPGASSGERVSIARFFSGRVTEHSTTFGIYVSGSITGSKVSALARLPSVVWLEGAPRMKIVDEIATKVVMGDDGNQATLASVQQLGFDGRGVTVAVADSGLDSGDPNTLHPDLFGRVDALFQYGGLTNAADEHGHGTHVAGIVAGDAATGETDDNGYLWGLGVAPSAHIVAQRIFDGAGNFFGPESYETLTSDAVRSGAYIGSNSWGDDAQGEYDLTASEFDALVRDADSTAPGEQPYVLEFSAGNAGPGVRTMDSPAVAKNVIATGACENNRYDQPIYGDGQEVMADFSSRGPCEDGRIKPDVVAPGTWISSLKSQSATDENAWLPIDDYYFYMGGTSQAGPHVSGACAVIVQWFRETRGGATPSPALVKAALINSAVPMGTASIPDPSSDGSTNGPGVIVVGGESPIPNNDEGWGRADLTKLIGGPRQYDFIEQGAGLSTGGVFEKHIVAGQDDQLKVTLAYTDVPGLPAAIPALVNDLDLEVVAPDGQLYRGNAFIDGETVPGAAGADRLNNVEAVHISAPIAGEYIVRVRGYNVVQDVHGRTNTAPQQDFALVISGELPAPGEGVISLNQSKYNAPSTAVIRLTDADLSGQLSASVTASSTSQTNGLTVLLQASGSSGSFVGSVALSTAPAPGQLLVADGDSIQITYVDANPPGIRTRTAQIDLTPPNLQNVSAYPRYGRVAMDWVADEPVRGVVAYGPTNGSFLFITNSAFMTVPEVILPALPAGQVCRYYVAGSDEAGNVSVNDNGGHYYYFTAPRPATAILLYSPETTLADSQTDYTDISGWTGPLDQLGIDYDIWNLGSTNRPPSSDELKQYKLVVWRPEEFISPPAGLTASIADYVARGGNLFTASAELLSRLDPAADAAFQTNILHVADFIADQGASTVNGVQGDAISAGLAITLDYSGFPDLQGFINWPSLPDQIEATPDAAVIFLQETGLPVGLRFPRTGSDSQGRVVFLSFDFESLPQDGDAPNNRMTLLGKAVEFLVPGITGASSASFDQPSYTSPASVALEVSDAERAGAGSVQAHVQSDSDAVGLDLSLIETPLRGVFRARFALTLAASDPSRLQLQASNTDTLLATYIDSTNRIVAATALIDTVPPQIQGVIATPAYNDAQISWTTDKETDALVRYGEKGVSDSFFTHSAYVSGAGTEHLVQLSGLLPNHNYYYEVISRDQAGNTAKDSNKGAFYSFKTLKPIPAPWTDDLEQGSSGWVVYDNLTSSATGGDGSGSDIHPSSWNFGVPSNSFGVQAHSGTNCWATNLGGGAVDTADSDLISPAIDLTGGNRAALHFWQWYDFTSRSDLLDVENGQVRVSTDNGATWNAVYSVNAQASSGWEPVDVDVSKYTGNVIRVDWNYQLVSFDTVARPGWFIDDVGVGITNIAPSNLAVSNNLSEAKFTVTGPPGFGSVAGEGLWFNVTNAVPGQYVVVWQPTPFYNPPPPRTNLLGAAKLIVYGEYTFPDANHNGVSDTWEMVYFGGLVEGDILKRDSDGDGASDYDEFIAGTDPTDPSSVLRANVPAVQANRLIKVSWPSVAGRLYRLESSSDLSKWSPASPPMTGTGNELTVTLPALGLTQPTAAYFFRVTVQP